MSKCRYCGKETDSNYKDNICSNCYEKLPVVKRLVKLFQVIKKECGVDVK